MNEKPNFKGIISLLYSRKFWLDVALVGSIISALDLDGWKKAVLITIAVTILILSIAIEDAAKKIAEAKKDE